MNLENFEDSTHKIVQRASESVFYPNKEEKAILYALAKDGPQILSDLEETISSYGEWETTRWAIKRRIKGSSDCLGLLEYEYLVEKSRDKRIRGKDGKLYCLTIKGILASLATGISLERTYLFKKYKKFIKDFLNCPIQSIGERRDVNPQLDEKRKAWLRKIIENYIKNQIYTFLIWHDANEINLRRKLDTDWYFDDFFNTHSEFIHFGFPKIKNERLYEEYRRILRRQFAYSKILHGLEHLTTKNDIVKDKDLLETIKLNFTMISLFVYKWYKYFDRLQMYSTIKKPYPVRYIPSFVISPPETGINIEYSGTFGHKRMLEPNIRKLVKDDLNEILKIQNFPINEIWNEEHDITKITSYGFAS